MVVETIQYYASIVGFLGMAILIYVYLFLWNAEKRKACLIIELIVVFISFLGLICGIIDNTAAKNIEQYNKYLKELDQVDVSVIRDKYRKQFYDSLNYIPDFELIKIEKRGDYWYDRTETKIIENHNCVFACNQNYRKGSDISVACLSKCISVDTIVSREYVPLSYDTILMSRNLYRDEILEPLIDKATKREHDSIIVALQQKYPFYPMKDINLDYYDHEAYLSKYTLASLKNNYSDKIIAQVIPFVGNLILLLFMFFFYRRHLKKNRSEMTEQSKILKNEQNLKDLEGNIFKSSPSVSYNNGVTYTSKHFEYEFEHTGNSVKENERRNNSSTNNQIRGLLRQSSQVIQPGVLLGRSKKEDSADSDSDN